MIKLILQHQPSREEFVKFLLLLVVLLSYFLFISWKYDLATGGLVSALTWSFFVLCTPVADAGFLLDFPIRLITGIRMFLVEIVVWVLAIVINIVMIVYNPDVYHKTVITSLLYQILTTPWPYWIIIILCGVGTFLSVRFGDELLDVTSHKERDYHHKHHFKYRVIAMISLLGLVVISYYYLLDKLGVHII